MRNAGTLVAATHFEVLNHAITDVVWAKQEGG
jgi:hypothetical protein